MFSRRKSHRTYSLTPYTGVGVAPPNSIGVDPAAVAAAASVSQSRCNSMSSELSSAAAAAAIRRHSLTTDSRGALAKLRRSSAVNPHTNHPNTIPEKYTLDHHSSPSLRNNSGRANSLRVSSTSGLSRSASTSGHGSNLASLKAGSRNSLVASRSTASLDNTLSSPSYRKPGYVRSPEIQTSSQKIVNPDRSMSLTTTTVRTLGSFQLISTKTTPIRAPPKKQKRKSSVHRQKGPSPNYASSLLSMESDLDSVLEEDDYYPTSNNNRLNLALPNISDDSNGTTLTSPRVSHHHISFSPQASIESDVIEKHRPPPRGVSPMKSALKSDHSHNGSIASNINSEEYPHVYLSTSNTMKRQSKVSFSSNDAINEFNAHHPPSASLAASQNYYPQSSARSAALGATSDPSGVHPSQQRASTGAKYTYDSVAHEVSKRTSNSSVGPSSPKQRHSTPSSPTLVPPKTRSSARPPAAKSKALAVNSNKKALKKSSSQQAPSSYQNPQTENEIYNFTYDDDNDSSSGDSIYSDASDFPMPIYGPNTPSYNDSSSPLSSKPKATSSSPSHGVKNTFKASIPLSNTPVVSRAQLQQKAQAQQKADEKQKAADKAHQKKSMVAAASFASHKHSQKPPQQGPNVAAASAAKRSSIINASGMSIPPAPIPKTPTKSKNAKQNPQPAKPPIAPSKAAVSVARKPSKSEPQSKQVRRTERAAVQQPQVPASGPQVATFKPEPLESLGPAGAEILANPGLPHSYRALIGDRDDDFEDGDNDNFEDDILQPVANPNPDQGVVDTLAHEEPEHDPTYSDDENIHNANKYPNIDGDVSDEEHDQGMEATDGLVRTEELEESTETELNETSFVNDTAAEHEELSDDEDIRELAETPAGTKNTPIGSHEPEVIKIDSASTGVSNTGDDGIEPSPVSSNPLNLENISSIPPAFSQDYEENLADSMGPSSPTFKEDNNLLSTPQIQPSKPNVQRGVAPQQRQQGPYPSPARSVANGQRPSPQGVQQNQTLPPRPRSAQQIRPPYSMGQSQGPTGSQQPQRASTMRAQNGTRPQSYQQPRSANVSSQKPAQRQRPQSLAPAAKTKMSPSPAHTAKFAPVKDDFPSLAPTLSDSSFDEERARRRKERQAKGPGFSLMSLRSSRKEPEDTYSSSPPALPNPAFDRTASLTLSSSRSPGGGFAAAQGLPPRQPFKSRIADDSDSDYEGMVSETFSGLKKKTRRGSSSNGGFLNSLRVSKSPQTVEGTTPASPGLLPSPTFSKPDDSYGRFSAPNSPVSTSKPQPLEYPQPSFIPSVAESPEPPSPQRKRGPLGALFARRQHIVDMQQQRARERKEHRTDAPESHAYPLSSGTLAGSNHNLNTNSRPFEPIMEHPPQRSSFVTDEGGSSPRTNVSYPQSQSSQPTIATSTTTPVNTKSSIVGANDLNAGAKTLLPPVNLDQGALQTPVQVGLADSSKGTVAQAPVPEKTVEAPVKKKRFRLKNMFKKK